MDYFKYVIVISLYLFWVSWIDGRITEGIVGGDIATKGQCKYQVVLQVNGDTKCGGGIIKDKFAITAAHCVICSGTGYFVQARLTVVVNAIDLNSLDESSLVVDVIKIYIPKIYKRHLSFKVEFFTVGDLAVLELEHGLGLKNNDNIQSLNINTEHGSYVNEPLLVAGYGFNKMTIIQDERPVRIRKIGSSDGKLRVANAIIIPKEDCLPYYNITILVTGFCARVVQRDIDNPEGACLKDSGAPLVYDGNVLVGILVAGPTNCDEGYKPGLYVEISYYQSFIQNAMNGKEKSDMRVATRRRISDSVSGFIEHPL